MVTVALSARSGLVAQEPTSVAAVVPQSARLAVVEPRELTLRGADAFHGLLVTAVDGDHEFDVTGVAEFLSLDPGVVAVDSTGELSPVGNGTGRVEVLYNGASEIVTVHVHDAESLPPVSFERDVMPMLAAQGCSTGPCHGKARGQNGFQLSLLGFDPDFDHDALTRQARGRRIFPAAPARSLLLQKATAQVPHGGGQRIHVGDTDYEALRRWIEAGAPRRIHDEPHLTGIELLPAGRRMRPGQHQSLLVIAHYSDGARRDVTNRSMFQSSDSVVASVSEAGAIVAGEFPGEATVMARFMNHFATCHVLIPHAGSVAPEVYSSLPVNNFIDELVWKKLQELNLTPSDAIDDLAYQRRVTLDLIGRLPTPEEVRAFLEDPSPDKRARWVDSLLERPEYADRWANLWADLLRPNPYRVGIKAVLNYDNWIREQFRENRPYNEMVTELLTARGSTWDLGATTLYRDRRSPDELATITSRLFLGIRLECAKCHHHPFERWSQADFYSLAAYFARVGRKGTGLSPPISGGEEIVFLADSGTVRHPRTGDVLPPQPLFGEALVSDGQDPRQALAAWMTSEDNEYFARVAVNRVWAELMGRGLVDPVDDLRLTNPATNEPLLAALADEFRSHDYDLHHLLRVITASHVYALSSLPNDGNVSDRRNYSRHYRRRMRAEVLLDVVHDVTGVPARFSAMPPDSRAHQIWTHRVGSVFLDTFGRPDPNQDPPCERLGEATVTQALHLMNSPDLHRLIADDQGRAKLLADSDRNDAGVVTELYLLLYSRYPDAEEMNTGLEYLSEDGSRRAAVEDLMWAMMNAPEFFMLD